MRFETTPPLNDEQRRMVLAHLKLARGRVNQFLRRYPGLRDRREDLDQEAYMGLVRAAGVFNPNRGLKFSTYAWWSMGGEIGKFVNSLRRHNKKLQDAEVGLLDLFVSPDDERSINREAEKRKQYAAIKARLRRPLVRKAKKSNQSSSGKNVDRDIDVFLKYQFGDERLTLRAIGQQYGFSHERVNQLVKKVKPVFNRVVAEIRKEAA